MTVYYLVLEGVAEQSAGILLFFNLRSSDFDFALGLQTGLIQPESTFDLVID